MAATPNAKRNGGGASVSPVAQRDGRTIPTFVDAVGRARVYSLCATGCIAPKESPLIGERPHVFGRSFAAVFSAGGVRYAAVRLENCTYFPTRPFRIGPGRWPGDVPFLAYRKDLMVQPLRTRRSVRTAGCDFPGTAQGLEQMSKDERQRLTTLHGRGSISVTRGRGGKDTANPDSARLPASRRDPSRRTRRSNRRRSSRCWPHSPPGAYGLRDRGRRQPHRRFGIPGSLRQHAKWLRRVRCVV